MKNQEEFKLDEVKKNCKSDNDDTVYFLEEFIKSCFYIFLTIGVTCLIAYGMVISINTLTKWRIIKWRIISKTLVAETSDTADKNDLLRDDYAFDFLDYYYILYND